MVAYYNSRNWHYKYLSLSEQGMTVGLLTCDRGRLRQVDPPRPVTGPVTLRAELDDRALRFSHRRAGDSDFGGEAARIK